MTYDGADAVNRVRNLEIPLFIGRVNLPDGRIELFTTHALNRVLLEGHRDSIHLRLDLTNDSPPPSGVRLAYLGPPVYVWSLSDASKPEFQAEAHAVLRPHVEALTLNRRLRDIQYQEVFHWETGRLPTGGAWMMSGPPDYDIGVTLRGDCPLHQVTHLRSPIAEAVRRLPGDGGHGPTRPTVGLRP